MASLSRSALTKRANPQIWPSEAHPLLRRTSSLSTAGRPQWPVYRPAPTGRANPQIWPLKAQFAIAPHKQFINGRSATVFIQAGPVAILSKPIIMAILSKSNGCFINAPRSGLGGPIRYCAAQAVYQRLAGHVFDRGRPRWPVSQGQLRPEGRLQETRARSGGLALPVGAGLDKLAIGAGQPLINLLMRRNWYSYCYCYCWRYCCCYCYCYCYCNYYCFFLCR